MNKGLIFNIQKFSLHDGPGIRTTIFFKGCPLRCAWCANPESNSPLQELFYSCASCVGCRTCEGICVNKAVSFENNNFHLNTAKCINCFSCVDACPTDSLQRGGTWYSVEELVQEAKSDLPFYEKSGGGVTLSGGEPLFQSTFAISLLKALKKEGIHTNIETTGYVSGDVLSSAAEYLDLIYMDFKHPDSNMHLKKTGVPNEPVLKNLFSLLAQGKNVVVRIPVIPHFNHSPETAHEYGKILSRLQASQVHLLPFHQLGQNKWKSLDRTYEYENEPSLQKEDVLEMYHILSSYGLQVQING